MPCDNEQLSGGLFHRRFAVALRVFWLTLICLYFGSRSRKQVSETAGADKRKLAKPTAVQKAEAECAFAYCKYYADVSHKQRIKGRGRCNQDETQTYKEHWLLRGEKENRYRCGNFTRICDRIWRGDFGQGELPNRVDIVVAHCTENMGWLDEFIESINIVSHVEKVTIISKCSVSTESAPRNSSIITFKNVGRNDHTYLVYIKNKVLDDKSLDDNAVILFVKGGAPALVHQAHGNTRAHRQGEGFMPVLLPVDYVLKVASATGFACMVEHYPASLYHNSTVLNDFSMRKYKQTGKKRFKSTFSNLGDWVKWSEQHARAIFPQQREVVPVCYEGNFAARVSNIRRQKEAWQHFETALRRGDNIEEGHFMERTWATILKDEAGNRLLEIPHHAAHMSVAYGSDGGRYLKCSADYHADPPDAIDEHFK